MILLDIFVPGTPIAQPRHMTNRKTGGRYLTLPKGCKKHPVEAWRELICLTAKRWKSNNVFFPIGPNIPLEMKLDFYFKPPKSWSKKKIDKLFGAMVNAPHCQKPDRKNLLAAVEDALNGVIYQDDCQLWCGDVRKYWTEDEEGVNIFIQTKEGI